MKIECEIIALSVVGLAAAVREEKKLQIFPRKPVLFINRIYAKMFDVISILYSTRWQPGKHGHDIPSSLSSKYGLCVGGFS